jgi:tRNA-binding protein
MRDALVSRVERAVHAVCVDGPLFSWNCAGPIVLAENAMSSASPISWDQFDAVDIRVGVIVAAEPYPEARKPAIKLRVDFGPELGVRRSSAQLTRHYTPDSLLGRQVLAVVNFPPRQIGKFISECLVLGVPDADGEPILLTPDMVAPLGGRLY